MVIEVEFRIPGSPSEAFRREVLARAPGEREDCCPACGADRFHLLDALCDPDCWENRGLAVSILRGCRTCRQAVGKVLAEAQASMAVASRTNGHGREPALALTNGHIMAR